MYTWTSTSIISSSKIHLEWYADILFLYQCFFVFTWNGYLWGGDTSWPPTILSSSSGMASAALHKKLIFFSCEDRSSTPTLILCLSVCDQNWISSCLVPYMRLNAFTCIYIRLYAFICIQLHAFTCDYMLWKLSSSQDLVIGLVILSSAHLQDLRNSSRKIYLPTLSIIFWQWMSLY